MYTRLDIGKGISLFVSNKPSFYDYTLYIRNKNDKKKMASIIDIDKTIKLTDEDLMELIRIIKARKNNPRGKIRKGGNYV